MSTHTEKKKKQKKIVKMRTGKHMHVNLMMISSGRLKKWRKHLF